MDSKTSIPTVPARPETPPFKAGTHESVYAQLLQLAPYYFPKWADQENWPVDGGQFPSRDPGLVVAQLSALLYRYVVGQLNQLPEKNRLAFFQLLELAPRLPVPAQVYLHFGLTEESTGAVIAEEAEVSDEDDSDRIFSTMAALDVLPGGLSRVVSVEPSEDSYALLETAASGESGRFRLFGDRQQSIPMAHLLYLSDEQLLNIQSSSNRVTLTLEGTYLLPEFFATWRDGAGNFIESRVISASFSRLTIELSSIQAMEPSTVDGLNSYWIRVQPHSSIKITPGMEQSLPRLSSIDAVVMESGLTPDNGFAEESPIDFKQGFFPFGEEPALGSAFYFSSDEVFQKVDALMSLSIELEAVLTQVQPVIQWEYWDGDAWLGFWAVDRTNGLTQSGTIEFNCPAIEATTIEGELGLWIRARLVEGNYGTAGEYVVTEPVADAIEDLKGVSQVVKDSIISQLQSEGYNFGYQFDPPSYTPPFIESFTISYRFSGPLNSNNITYNNFAYQFLSPNHRPYVPYPETNPVLLLGYSAESFTANQVGKLATQFFAFCNAENAGRRPEIAPNTPLLQWMYSTQEGWEALAVNDGTEQFQGSGIVTFKVPEDICLRDLFTWNIAAEPSPETSDEDAADTEQDTDETLYWIQVQLLEGQTKALPASLGIYPNTVAALNRAMIEEEILGSSDGQINQQYAFSSTPVLESPWIEVQEPILTTEVQTEALASAEDARVVRDDTGKAMEIWIRWYAVENFVLSSATSRHFVFDSTSGTILFGDGVNGMVPPSGINNVVARRYFAGGGLEGNVEADTLTRVMEEYTDVAFVRNPRPAFGGADGDDREAFGDWAPARVQNQDRAVAAPDFAALAALASPRVARATCRSADGVIRVPILAQSNTEGCIRRLDLLDEVQAYLDERALFTIRDRIQVCEPEYTRMRVIVEIALMSQQDRKEVVQNIRDYLDDYWDPLTGNTEGQGWTFGAEIYFAKLIGYLEQRGEEAYRVTQLLINGIDAVSIRLDALDLPTAGEAEVIFGNSI